MADPFGDDFTMEDTSVKLLTIPTEVEDIQFRADELPDDPEEIINVFLAENVPIDVWLSFARVYHSQGKPEAFLQILEKSTENESFVRDHAKESGADAQQALVDTYDALAGYYLDLASKIGDPEERKKPFAKAMNYYNRADTVNHEVAASYAGKGIWAFRSGQAAQDAVNHFNVALEIDSKFVPALLGKAELYFSQGEYEKALKMYMKTLRLYPGAPSSLRVAMARCLFHLGKIDDSRSVLETVVEMDPMCADALSSLGILVCNSGEKGDIATALTMFKRAFNINSRHPVALNHLANHFMVIGNYSKAIGLAEIAYHSTQVPPLQAESCYIIGRCHHAQKGYEKATSYYRMADKLYKNFLPAQFGLGQMFVLQDEIAKAIQCFLRVEQKYPNDKDTLRILASLCARSVDKRQQMSALPRLTKLAAMCPNEPDIQIELGEFLERTQPSEALAAYETAFKLLSDKHRVIPVTLLNNIGALRQFLANKDPAQLRRATTAYGLAVHGTGAKLELLGDDETVFSDDAVTTLYNMARVAEDLDEADRAKSLYHVIIDYQPHYVDCWLRLGMMAQVHSDDKEAARCFMEAINYEKDSIDAWVLMGSIHMEKQEWLMAQRKFEHILASIDAKDPYALVALGNVYYFAYYSVGAGNEKADKYCQTALKYFSRVLLEDPFNVPAACGTSIILAEKGKLGDVKDTLTQISEIIDSESTWINVGHAALAQGHHVKAIKTYSMCLRRFSCGHNSRIMSYLAKAHFEVGEFAECINVLEKAIHISPSEPALRFNLALAKRNLVKKMSDDATCTSSALSTAIEGLVVASNILKGLSHSLPPHTVHWHDRVDPIVAQNIECTIADVRRAGEVALTRKTKEEEEAARMRRELHMKLLEAEKKKEEEEKEMRRQLEKKQEELKSVQTSLQQRVELYRTARVDDQPPPKKRRQVKKAEVEEEAEEEFEEPVAEEPVTEVAGGLMDSLFGGDISDSEDDGAGVGM